MTPTKTDVHDFWQERACGEVYAVGESEPERRYQQEETRYLLEPYIRDFARFESAKGKDVLEIGVGMGADHLQWARAHPRRLTGIDLTEKAVNNTRERLFENGFVPDVSRGDAEALPFPEESFDIVYSWGVLHHTPDTPKAIREVHRVLRKGGVARVMIYHRPSITGFLLWLGYGLLSGDPFTGQRTLYTNHLESPGTKGYSRREARALFRDFSRVNISIRPGTGDLLLGEAGSRHGGSLMRILRPLWPRWAVRTVLRPLGLAMMIEASKDRYIARRISKDNGRVLTDRTAFFDGL